MTTQETLQWQSGASDAPLPPLADLQKVGNAQRLFVELYRSYGPVFRMPLGRESIRTVLAGPEANTFIARHGDEFFSTREQWEDFDTAAGSRMSQSRDGSANKQRRARSGRSYSRVRILDQLQDMVEIAREQTQTWQPGTSFELRPALQRIVAEQLGLTLVRQSPGDYLQDFITFLDTSIASSFGGSQQAKEALTSPTFLNAKARTRELGRIILEAHRAAGSHSKPDLLDDALVDAARHPEQYPEYILETASLGPFLAGIDTVANTSSFLFYALLKNPDVLTRVIKEADELFAQGPVTWETLKGMQALHGAAMETLRLYPVAGGHMATLVQPLTINGYRLEPGEQVFTAMTVPHFLPELFPDPEKFDIDRYHDPRNEHRQRGAYAPFGLGDHTCLGAGIAEIQLMLIAATLLHDYELAIDPPDYELVVAHEPTAHPGNHFSLQVVGRT